MIVPLGQRESLTLEFKQAEVLENAVNVAREVAAMLNAAGGEIWIGIKEQNGAAQIAERIPEVEAARRRLHDSLVDRLEPAPTDEEVRIEVVGGLLVVKVAKGSRGPYAFIERSMRGFVIRVDARVRVLSLEELRTRFRGKHEGADPAEVALAKRRGKPREPNDGAHAGLFVWFASTPELEVSLRADELKKLLNTPESSHNRRMGWNFSSEFHSLEVKGGKAVWAPNHRSHAIELSRTGDLTFFVPLDRLHWKGDPNEIYPWALIEYVLSVLRLYAEIAKQCSPKRPNEVLIALSLRGVGDWTLRPHSPRSVGYERAAGGKADTDIELKPIRFDWAQFGETPDRCGWRMLELVYDHFGFCEAEMPVEYNRQTSRFELPN